MSDGQRVLVVDDMDEIRTLIRRVLHTGGFQVETAATLAEARAMSPGGFEAVIVDAHLGPDRGTDLVTLLQAQDPAAVRRCLVITGGSLADMPTGVASLSKPFLPTQLLAAVRELLAHSPAPGSGTTVTGETPPHPSAPAPLHPAAEGLSPPSATPPLAGDGRRPQEAPETASGGGWGWPVLALARDLRARERAGLAGYLHDRPVQELTAATLSIHILRKQVPAAQEQLDELAERLEAASSALRRVTDASPLSGQAFAGPEAAIRERTAWLLGEPASLAVTPGVVLTAAEAEAVADVAELVLLPLTGEVPQRAHIEVGTAGRQIEIGTTVTPCRPGPSAPGQPGADARAGQATAGDPAAGEQAAVNDRAGTTPAGSLARSLGGAVSFENGPDWCRVRLTVPRANLTGPGPG